MIICITGLPASGKTLEAISMISEAIKQNRNVYTNISTSNSVVPDDFYSRVLKAPEDWRDTPNGSLVVYDECQSLSLYSHKASSNDVLLALARHRHTSHDLVFISQCIEHIHPIIRGLCEFEVKK